MEQIIKNLIDARALLEAAPQETIDLYNFGRRKECGTLYCAAGWLAVSDRFSSIMGLHWVDTEYGEGTAILVRPGATEYNPATRGYYRWLNQHFGPDAFSRLFPHYGAGEFDLDNPRLRRQDHRFDKEALSDLDLALWRFDQQIKQVRKLQVV